MTSNNGRGTYRRPGARRRRQAKTQQLIAYIAVCVLLAAAVWAVVTLVRHNRAEEAARLAAQQQAQLQAEEEQRLQEEAQRTQAERMAQLEAYEQVFADNIYLDGELISGRTYEDVVNDFTNRYNQMLSREVKVCFNGAEWKFSPAMAGASSDVQAQIDLAWAPVHEGTQEERLAKMDELRQEPLYFTVTVTYDQEAVRDFALPLKEAGGADPGNATFEIVGEGKTKSTDSVLGYKLDAEATQALLLTALQEGSQRVDLLPETIEPEITEDELGGGYVKLAQFSTYFKGSPVNRAYNIRLALSNFHGMVVQPGQKVSFNKVVGDRTTRRGYREAVEYQDGQSVTGVGGGVCQASTTLYGAVLRAGLEINQRSAHSLPVKYVPPSQDATVSNQGTDLVFTNNTSGPIYIYTSVNKEKERATVSIYGTPVKSYVTIEIESEIVQGDIAASPRYIKDTAGNHVWYADEVPVLKKEGTLGYKSCAYRIYRHKESGKILKKELLSTDYYAPVAAEYYIGVH